MLGMKPEDVRCLYLEGSGCYGRNGHEDAAADAALIAKETGLPVRVQWMREDEHGWDPKGPPTLLDYRGALDDKGSIVGWESEVFVPGDPRPSRSRCWPRSSPACRRRTRTPAISTRTWRSRTTFPNIRATAHWLAETPFRPSWIRTPGRMQNTFANEMLPRRVAAAAGVDPFECRLATSTIRAASSCSARLKTSPPGSRRRNAGRQSRRRGQGRGVAYIKYELVRTYVGGGGRRRGQQAAAARSRSRSFFVAHDCGQIINPDGLRNQIEGNVVQTASRTLVEELKFDRAAVTSLDWESYPILRFPDVPEVAWT